MDPAVVMHGMNFFWRAAHLLPGAVEPLFVHANGVDAKDYMFRDRGLWFAAYLKDSMQYNSVFFHENDQILAGSFSSV